MSGKNRAFALTVATAALVGLSAPVASAATFDGPGGVSNDSLVNVSGNQIPVQACNDYIPVNILGGQLTLTSIAAALGLLSTGNQMASSDTSCTQNPAETNTTTVTTTSTTPSTSTTAGSASTTAGPASTSNGPASTSNGPAATSNGPADLSSGDPASGISNGGLVNVSGNQIPVQACHDNVPVNAVGIQGLANGLVPALGILSSGDVWAMQDSSCTQNPAETNSSSVASSASLTCRRGSPAPDAGAGLPFPRAATGCGKRLSSL